MRARDIMSNPVLTVTRRTPVKDAANLLSSNGITSLPVVDEEDELIGIVSEADLLAGRFPPDARYRPTLDDGAMLTKPAHTVGEVMTTKVISARPGTDIADIASIMLSSHVCAVPIVDDQRVVGIVARRDLIRTIARDDQTISRDVRHRLETYGGPGRWTVAVSDGVVAISDAYGDPTDRHVARVIAESVPGVARAETIAVVPEQR